MRGTEARNRGEKSPLVRKWFELFVNEDAVAVLPGLILQWQCDEVAKASAGHRVLVRKEAIVGLHAQFVATIHGRGDEIGAHAPRCSRIRER